MQRRYPERPIMAVGAIVVKNGRVLLARRGKEPSYGVWSVPGGAVRLGEGLKAAAVREIREECGIEIELTDVVEVIERLHRDGGGRVQYHYVIVDYLARWVAGKLSSSDEVLEARWVAPEEFPRYQMTTGTADVIQKMLAAGRRAGVL
ncbi:MAG TPA: NUDIX hydrolase [Candidatus Methylomirabilis sp.]|nr:NUDIX hydrolase [Candidatus Methylomirabilis sp.]